MSNAHQSSNRRRCNVVTLAAILASLGLPACSGQSTATAIATPNPDQAAGMVLHFYRDVAAGGLGAMTDLHGIVSPAFYQNHATHWNAQYGTITNPHIQIRSIRGRTVSYTLDYATPLNGWRLYSQRIGNWNLAYTNNRWLLDSDAWQATHVVAVRDNYGHLVTVHENVDPVGQREFVYRGFTYALSAGGWRRVAVASTGISASAAGGGSVVAGYHHGSGTHATGVTAYAPHTATATTAHAATHYANHATAQHYANHTAGAAAKSRERAPHAKA
jgi:hypothetical protein